MPKRTAILFAGFLALFGSRTSAGQPAPFGSADDPREAFERGFAEEVWRLDVMGGPSLIGSRLRGLGGFGFDVATRRLTARLQGTFRGDLTGGYGRDADEAYDLLRLIQFARYEPSPRSRLYLRAGPSDRIRLGTGHLVSFLNTAAAWDERTVAVEAAWAHPLADVAAFSDNVFLDGVVGGRLALRPFAALRDRQARSLELGLNYAADLADYGAASAPGSRLGAFGLDARYAAMSPGDFDLAPYLSYAWFPDYGRGFGGGLSLESLNFIDLGRFSLRLGLHRNSDRFVSGYFGSFHAVSNPAARILNSDAFLAGDTERTSVGVPLDSVRAGTDLVSELRVLFFERFELWLHFQRHYGPQPLSRYHARLFGKVSERLLLDLSLDRGGLGDLFSVFGDLNDQSVLLFRADYRLAAPFWLFLRAQYSYERIGRTSEGDRALPRRAALRADGRRAAFFLAGRCRARRSSTDVRPSPRRAAGPQTSARADGRLPRSLRPYVGYEKREPPPSRCRAALAGRPRGTTSGDLPNRRDPSRCSG